jgi:hypothetical protein
MQLKIDPKYHVGKKINQTGAIQEIEAIQP